MNVDSGKTGYPNRFSVYLPLPSQVIQNFPPRLELGSVLSSDAYRFTFFIDGSRRMAQNRPFGEAIA
jgi:hypothetical protein